MKLNTRTKETGRALSLKEVALRLLAFAAIVMAVQLCLEAPPQLSRKEQGERKYHIGSISLSRISTETPVVALNNLTDLRNTTHVAGKPVYWQDAIDQRRKVIDILENAGIKIDLELLLRIPRWKDVTKLYGGKPVILGLERCHEFRSMHRSKNRSAAVAGMFNTGTNAMAQYFFQNLAMPDNPKLGILANVPWHKHGVSDTFCFVRLRFLPNSLKLVCSWIEPQWVALRGRHFFRQPNDHSSVLPVVIVRDPYQWFQSMCESPYLLKWNHDKSHCPNLVDDRQTSVPAQLALGPLLQYKRTWDSLVHVWSEWYGEYYDAHFPRLMIRFEGTFVHVFWSYDIAKTPEIILILSLADTRQWRLIFLRYFVSYT